MKLRIPLFAVLLSLFVIGGCSTADKKVVSTDKSSPASGSMVQGTVAGGTFYSSGLMPFAPGSGDLISGGLEAETHQAMRNMKAMLEGAGMTLDDLSHVTIYSTAHRPEDFATINKTYAPYFEAKIFPTRAFLRIAALANKAQIELVATASKARERTRISTDTPAHAPFSPGLLKDGVLYSSGLLPFVPVSGDLVSKNIEEQTHQVMRNTKALLAQADMTLKDLNFVTLYVTDLKELPAAQKVYASYFEDKFYPPMATLEIGPISKGARVELVVTARK